MLEPDNKALQALPKDSQKPVKFPNVSSSTSVYALKERLSRTLQAGIPPSVLVIIGSSEKVPLKDTLSLAYYNIPSAAQLTFSLKN